MAVALERTAKTTSSITLRITGLSGSKYTKLNIILNGVTKAVTLSGTTTTTATFTGLTAGTSYSASGDVLASTGHTATPTGSFYTTFNPVSSVTINNLTTSTARANWTAPAGGKNYRLAFRNGSSYTGSLIKEYFMTGTYQNFTGLSPNTTYFVGIVNGYGVEETTAATTTFTTPMAIPSTPTGLSISSVTSTSVKLSWSSASGATGYRIETYYNGSTRLKSETTTSTSTTVVNLSSGVTYTFRVYAYNSAGDSTSYASGSATTVVTVSPMSGLTSSVSTNSMTVSWNSNTTVTSLEYELRLSSASGSIVSSGSITGTSRTFTGLSYNTDYYFRIRGSYGSTYTSWVAVTDTTTPSSPTFSLTSNSTTAGIIYVYFNTVDGATGYKADLYDGKTNAYVKTVSGTTSPLTFSGLNEYYPYSVYLKATSSNGDSSQSSKSITTKDVTPPSVSITSAISDGVMQLNWSASDSHSGLKATNTYLVWITANGGATYSSKAYTTNKYYSFTTDANGDEFVHGGKYYVKVTAYDAENNESSATSSQLTFARSRPSDWTWQNTKVKDGIWNMTAQEWNSLCTRINQFRQYKKLDNYTFTTAKVGEQMTATIYNQVRTAINAMSPPTALPSAVSSGMTILASHFLGLTNSLNSIR